MVVRTSDRLQKARHFLKANNVQAFFVPSEDAHQSEYIADCDKRRHWISGFTGSAGCAVVSEKEAALFTDGRYFLQASQQLDENWTLMKQGLPKVPTWQEYLVKNLPAKSRIGVDPTLITASDASSLEYELQSVGSTLVPLEKNIIDLAWGAERPAPPTDPVIVQTVEYAGVSHTDKLASLRKDLEAKKIYGTVISALDEVAWLFNLRGSDVECNPVFFSYAIVTLDQTTLYVDHAKLGNDVLKHLGDQVSIKPYNEFFLDLKNMAATLSSENKKLLINSKTSLAVEFAVQKQNTLMDRSLVNDAKAIKNPTELEGMRQCHLRDAAALCHYFAWLEDQLGQGKQLSEVDAADYLENLRRQQKDFVGLSFDTISSTGANGAIIHYKPEPESCKIIDPKLIYLCDSGGQYRDGTTDVTRTYHFGQPNDYEKRCFTRVLQGHIAIDRCVFPLGTTGYLLDPFARHALWRDGLDFRHGTGHGVGAFLNVHEGPHGIGTRTSYNDSPFAEGMTVTNEPGYYEDGKFGIRIENVLLVRKADTPHNFGSRGYLGFEHVTLVPIGNKLIDQNLLSPEEKQWVNEYHVECLEKVGALLPKDSPGYKWLAKETAAI
ncbi:peptidase M24, structural domain-containing protein [Umbelopsis sp. AD052]|nr:peptidase M24, structural domain-containing protein [Umbelopsis sp. AD052]